MDKTLKKERKLLFFRLKYKALETAYPDAIEPKMERVLDNFLQNATVNLTEAGGLPSADKIVEAEGHLVPIVRAVVGGETVEAASCPWPFCPRSG